MLQYALLILSLLPRTASEANPEYARAVAIAEYADEVGGHHDVVRTLAVLWVYRDGLSLDTSRPYGTSHGVHQAGASPEDTAYGAWLYGLAHCRTERGAFSYYATGRCRPTRGSERAYVRAVYGALTRLRSTP